jgi:hypothetical protein
MKAKRILRLIGGGLVVVGFVAFVFDFSELGFTISRWWMVGVMGMGALLCGLSPLIEPTSQELAEE